MKAFDRDLQWFNEPPTWRFNADMLEIETSEKTDYWRDTFYNFWRDDGHFLFEPVFGDFTAEVTIQGEYDVLYDQAGLMVRLSETHWIKAGVEFTDGQMYFSVVVTNDTSDWSLVNLPFDKESGTRIRLTRHHEAIRVQYLDDPSGHWIPVRLAYLPPSKSIDVGLMCCSPERAGFKARFKDYSVGPAISRDLHD